MVGRPWVCTRAGRRRGAWALTKSLAKLFYAGEKVIYFTEETVAVGGGGEGRWGLSLLGCCRDEVAGC